jgi:hypothetical protein
MIHCPKCNFRQPKDQYCANCGIDITAFKPVAPSKAKNLFSSGQFQFFILFLASAIAAYFIAQNDNPQNWVKKLSYSKSIRLNSTNLASQKSNPNDSTSADIQLAAAPDANISDLASVQAPAAASIPENTTTDSAKENLISAEIKLTFAEVSRDIWLGWINESQRLGLYQTFTDFSAGILPHFKNQKQIQFKDLKSEQKKYFLKKPQALLLGKTIDESSEFLGFQTNIDLKSIENQLTKGHLNITKILRSGKFDLPIEFELQKGAVFFVNWKTAMIGFENESFLFSTPPFQILQSSGFLNQKTELIILIEPL